MNDEENLKFFEKSIDLIRKKTLEKMRNAEKKPEILALIGAHSKSIDDFEPIFVLLKKPGMIHARRLAAKKLAEAGFLHEARSVADGIARAEDSFDVWLYIASISGDGKDFLRVSENIENLKQEIPVLNENDKRRGYQVNKSKKFFIMELASAGKYQWALREIEKSEDRESLYGIVSDIIMKKAYAKKEAPGYIVNDTKDVPLAFQCAMKSGIKEPAIIAVILLLNENKVELARSLVDSVDDSTQRANYFKANCYISIAIATKNADDAEKAFKYAIKSKMIDPKDDALRILIKIGISARNLYCLGLAYDMALEIGNELYDIEYMLSQLSRLKTTG